LITKSTKHIKFSAPCEGILATALAIKELAYKALVRPHLEYASPVWDPWMEKHIKQLEAVQRRSARFVKSCWARTPGTVTNLLNDLDCPPLQVRRKIARLTLFHKAIQGESAIELASYIKGCNCQLRSTHHNRFTKLRPRTEAYRNSFYCRTIKEWNSLPNNVLDVDYVRVINLYFLFYFLFLLFYFILF